MHKHTIFYLIAVVLLASSCNNYSKTETGLRYKFLKKSTIQDLPELGEYIQCYYSIDNSDDSTILSIFGKTPDRIMLTQPTHKGGDIMEALSIMSEGDSAQFLISADSFYLITRQEIALPGYVKPGTDLKFTIKMDRRLNKYQVDSLVNAEKIKRWKDEIDNINNYVRKNGLTVALDSSTGIRMQFHSKMPDSTRRVHEGSVVKFHFIGKLMDGTEFYNSYTMGQPQTVRVVREQFQPIGMYEMLIKMREGEKATFVLPYDLAFGAKGVEGMIPPFSTLIYELNILKVE
ncbi:MAG: FKBP-type peptidyl-prolyl cis-trans isomerase (rotamase) [Schumannella sp.]|nr:FKBP-type peptidyl-prolyl cis-trans isomerase (rotamase) [Schumannella sp.]